MVGETSLTTVMSVFSVGVFVFSGLYWCQTSDVISLQDRDLFVPDTTEDKKKSLKTLEKGVHISCKTRKVGGVVVVIRFVCGSLKLSFSY